MHGLFYEEFARVVAHEAPRRRDKPGRSHGPGPPPPRKRARRVVAGWLAAAASRVDREAARRAVA